jgi:sortase (surface protein transpeptidase)
MRVGERSTTRARETGLSILRPRGRHRRRSRRSGVSVAALGVVLIGGSIVAWTRPVHRAVGPEAINGRDARTLYQLEDRPVHIDIPSIHVSAPVVPLGLNPDGTLSVPTGFDDAGWYAGSSAPGSPGASVIVGHLDSYRGPAVFYRLRWLTPGSRVIVELLGGSRRTFVVERVTEYPKARFPTQAVYGPTTEPVLRLITCGGPFDFSTGHYLDNVVVFAEATPRQAMATGTRREL